nr:hypothetical protein [Burkholderiales bacterium]
RLPPLARQAHPLTDAAEGARDPKPYARTVWNCGDRRRLGYDRPMSDDAAPPELARVLETSVRFYAAIDDILGDKRDIGTHRDLLTQGTIATAFEHGVSIVLLVEANQLASASVLLRAQFEALVRALWLHFAADDAWIESYFTKLQADPGKDPGNPLSMDKMLQHLAVKAPRGIASKLQTLKDAVWGPLNSYVHAGIHSVVHQHAGVPDEFAPATVRNSNGLTGMAALLAAELSGDSQQMMRILQAQSAHLDCLPPVIAPTRAPPRNHHEDRGDASA